MAVATDRIVLAAFCSAGLRLAMGWLGTAAVVYLTGVAYLILAAGASAAAAPPRLLAMLFWANVLSGWGFLYVVVLACCWAAMASTEKWRGRGVMAIFIAVATVADFAWLHARFGRSG